MDERISICRGCLLGIAVGDAMGHIVDEKSWSEIQEDYGPNGLLGYDLVNGCAAGSSYTQTATFVTNGLLLAVTRGKPELYLRYVGLSLREWARAQHFPRDPEKSYCWVSKIPQMRVRKCKDSRMLDALRFPELGNMERPSNRAATPGGLTGSMAAGLVCNGRHLPRNQAVRLGAQIVALTHGDPETWFAGSVLCEVIAALAERTEKSLRDVFLDSIDKMQSTFGADYAQAHTLADALKKAICKAEQTEEDPRAVMESLGCETAAQCLAAAMYACLTAEQDFDSALILAVNHSGRSAAVGAIVGGILGTRMGAEALPEFYMESLEPASVLEELTGDLAVGSPTAGLFDDDWDHKYVQGLPLGNH